VRTLDTLPVPPAGEPLAFLIGAGCSGNLPSVTRVTDALVDAVASGLHEVDPKLLALMRADVRFEFFFQTVRDVLDLDLSCLAEIYGRNSAAPADIPPTHYHHILARLLSETSHTVVSTNFDLMIEDAYANLIPAAGQPLHVLSSDDHDWTKPTAPHSLLKIHGSADDVASLCATFDTVSARQASKHTAFTEVLKKKSLCVLGSSGWYDDVLQVILDTHARDQSLYWFSFSDRKDGSHDEWAPLKDFHKLSTEADQPRTLLRSLVRKRHRAADRVFLIEGNTGKLFLDFLIRFGLPTDVDSSLPTYQAAIHGPLSTKLAQRIPQIMQGWVGSAGDRSGFRRRLICLDLGYIYGIEKSVDLSRLASRIRRQIGTDTVRASLGWPRVAKAAYDKAHEVGEYKTVVDYAERAIQAAERLQEEGCGQTPVDVAGLVEAYGWKAEGQRGLDDLDGALSTCVAAKRLVPWLFRRGAEPTAQVLRRAMGSLLNTEGEIYLALGQLDRARRSYAKASACYRDGGDLIWLLYARLGYADATRVSGRLERADLLYRELERDIHLTKDVQYLLDWTRLASIDLSRAMRAHGLVARPRDTWGAGVDGVIASIRDAAARDRAGATRLELRWMAAQEADPQNRDSEEARVEKDYEKAIDENTGSLYGAALMLSYAEFSKLRAQPELQQASDRAREALSHAQTKRAPLLELWAMLEKLDLERLQGEHGDGEDQAHRCEQMQYPLGLAYAHIAGRALGHKAVLPEPVAKFLRANRLQGLLDEVEQAAKRPYRRRGIRLAFPGLLTVY
jgi:SIR2-like domain